MSELSSVVTHPQALVVPLDGLTADDKVFVFGANGAEGLDTKVVDVRELAPLAFPPRTVSPRVVTDQASFAAEVKRRALADGLSTVWGNRKTGEITVVYNDLADAGAEYTRRDDNLILRFVPDPDWATLLKVADGKLHSQEELADLIESASHLITSHPAAELIEIVNDVRASSKGSFESKVRRDNGSINIVYSEEVTAKAGPSSSSSKQLEVPREITLVARPFEDYPQVEVQCWMRLRINQGQLFLGLFPKPYEHLVRAAWTHVTGEVSKELGVPVYAANLGR